MDRDDQTAIEMVERLAACTAKHHLILDLQASTSILTNIT
jgi:alpha-glucosidase